MTALLFGADSLLTHCRLARRLVLQAVWCWSLCLWPAAPPGLPRQAPPGGSL